MSILSFLGNVAKDIGQVQDFLPNKILSAFHLPTMTSPLHMIGDAATQGKKFQFGREFGNNVKLGAMAAGGYFAAPLVAQAAPFLAHQGASLLGRFGLNVGGAAAGPVSATGAVGPGAGSGMGFVHVPGVGTIPDFASMPSGTAAIWGNGGEAGAMDGATNSRGTGVATNGTTAPKPMNPILKSFMDNAFASMFRKQPSQQTFQLPQFGSHGLPGREHVGVLGGGYANG